MTAFLILTSVGIGVPFLLFLVCVKCRNRAAAVDMKKGSVLFMRLDKMFSVLQVASRSECKKFCRAGRVLINGVPVKDSGQQLDPERDQVQLDGVLLSYTPYEYYVLYKPAGCVTAREDASCRTVMDYIPKPFHKDLSPVGRLDKDTEGLLLLTDDGAFNHALMAPGHHVPKKYYARIAGQPDEQTIAQFAAGLDIGDDKITAPAVLEILSVGEESEIWVTITEGRYHQVKRMFQAVNMSVQYLKRISMGSFFLDPGLAPGECRKLTVEEVATLKREAGEKNSAH